MTSKSKKAVVTGVLLASANAVAGGNANQFLTINQISKTHSQDLAKAISEEFRVVHGVNLDWNSALEVSDDEEGNSRIFSPDSGKSIRVPIEATRFTAPNKIDAGN